jgi:hypothetical protein
LRDLDVFVAALDASGEWTWVASLGGSGDERDPRIQLKDGGQLLVAASTLSGDLPERDWETPTPGGSLWTATLNRADGAWLQGGRLGYNASVDGLVTDSDGTIYLSANEFAARLDAAGRIAATAPAGRDRTLIAAREGRIVILPISALGEVAAATPATVFRTLLHPHPKNPFVSIELVAMDLSRLRVGWTIGKADAGAERLEPIRKPGLVPAELQPDAVAVFNGGFQARHGWWGQMTHDIAFVPPKDSGCTVGLSEDGSVTIAPWSAIAERRHELLSFRQGPPCLLSEGNLHPNLEKGLTRVWAGQNPKLKTRRRSALGIDAERRVLYFGIGTEAGPLDLARGMQAAGAHTAVQLDINFAWTRFLLVGRVDDEPRITTSLVPDSLHGKNEYFGRASDRDFFYVVRQ